MERFIAALFAFLLGSIPVGLLLARAKGVDIRAHGSGNIGATNVRRVLGKKAAAVTFALDVLKGVAAVYLPALLDHESSEMRAICGVLALLGHCYTPFLKFNGGKGVATGFGVFLALAPAAAVGAVVSFSATFRITRIVSIGSLTAVAIFLAVIFGSLAQPYDAATKLAATCCAAVIVLRHRTNIMRLRSGNEHRLEKHSVRETTA